MHALSWEVYINDNEEFIKREFLVSVPHPKRRNIFWNCVKYHILDEKEQYKYIGLRGFVINYLGKRSVGG